MGVPDWFRPRAKRLDVEALRDALFDALARKDYERAMHLINENSDRIRNEFRSWTTVPEPISKDADAVNRYANALMTIARVFERSGDASLRIYFEGGGRDTPLAEWNDALQRAQQLTESGQAAEAVVLLRTMLDDVATTTGTGVSYYRARGLGRLGVALKELGNTSEALHATREALEICRQTGDEEGVEVYLQNLDMIGSFEIREPRSGQRLTVVVKDSDGRILLPDELSGSTSKWTWEVRDVRPAHPEAQRLRDEGRAAAQTGDYDTAIALFTNAADLDPSWPHPVYDRAFTHLLKRNFAAALADYRKTLELSPLGFFIAATAADMLTREAAGEFPDGLYAAFAMLEHMPVDAQRQFAAQLVAQSPSHAPAWELHARLLDDPSAKLEAIERGLLAHPDPETRGSLLVQKALALHASGKREAALAVVDPLTSDIGESARVHVQARIAAALIRSRGAGAGSTAQD